MDRTGLRSSGRSSPSQLSLRERAGACATRSSLAWCAMRRCRPWRRVRCELHAGAIVIWAERATTAELLAVRGAWIRPADPEDKQAQVLLLGPAGSLPALEEGTRFWGTELLVPLGFRAEPDLPAAAIRRAAGATADELAVLDEDGIELIPRAIFKPLSRAAVRRLRAAQRRDCGEGAACMTFPRAAFYLQIPALYCRSIGGLRWAHYGEAVEFLEGPAAGLTFAFAPRSRCFSKAFEAWRGAFRIRARAAPLVLDRAGGQGRGALEPSGQLPGASCRAVPRKGMPAAECRCSVRGAVCGCTACGRPTGACGDSRDSDGRELGALDRAVYELAAGDSSGRGAGARSGAIRAADQPAAGALLLIRRFATGCGSAAGLPSGTLRICCRSGRRRYRTYSRIWSDGRGLPGAGPGAAGSKGCSGCRRGGCDRPELQGGGYSDLTTRGAPERILPIQFALDGEEFIRRFAEGELLVLPPRGAARAGDGGARASARSRRAHVGGRAAGAFERGCCPGAAGEAPGDRASSWRRRATEASRSI